MKRESKILHPKYFTHGQPTLYMYFLLIEYLLQIESTYYLPLLGISLLLSFNYGLLTVYQPLAHVPILKKHLKSDLLQST